MEPSVTIALAEYERLKRDRDEAVAAVRFYEDAIVDLIKRSGPLTEGIIKRLFPGGVRPCR